MNPFRGAGVHFPNGPEKFGMLSTLPASLWLMTSPEARYHYDKMRKLGKVVVWRDVPAPGNRPAELRYDARKAADAAMVLWNEQPHSGIEHFQSHCELTLNYERGDREDDFQNLDARHERLARFLAELEPALRARLPTGTRLHFPPWVPDGRSYDRLDLWRDVANRYDVISCLLPDQRVTARGITRGTMRRYEGDVITIETASGNKVTATPNHPILTRRGWLPAGEINEGSEIAQYSVSDSGLRRSNDVHVPTPISEVFRTLCQEFPTTGPRRGQRDDFHGDGMDGDVDVVGTDGLLRHTFREPLQYLRFPRAQMGHPRFARSGSPHLLLNRTRPGPAGLATEGLSLPSKAADPTGLIGPLLCPESLCFAVGAQRPTPSLKQSANTRSLTTETFAEFSERFPGQVSAVRVLNVDRRQWSGHVYNLSTLDNIIVADNIITHNCHEYGPPEGILERVQWHLDTWPTKGVILSEWHNDEPERTLQLLADLAAKEPRFLGATWFIAHWYGAPGDWPQWKNLQDNEGLYRIFLNPPLAAIPEPVEPEPMEPIPMNEYEAFIRDAAQRRGIDPDIAVRVANSEGSVTEPARRGTFDTGSSWWAFQLHYGGIGYEYLGTVAGMGNGFTTLTGWRPGDPAAWKDATRYALNRAKLSGWGAWYGAAHVGIGRWDGIDRDAPWNAKSERWDYEDAVVPAVRVMYNANEPAHAQEDSFDCSQESLEWALFSLGRAPADDWLENTMIAEGVMSKAAGLLDASGAGLAAFVGRHYGEFGYYANHESVVTFDGVAFEGDHAYPLLIGGRSWGHWSGCRGYDAARDLLLLANPAENWMGVGQTMSRGQFDALGQFSMVRILHPDLLEVAPAPPAPDPIPVPQPSRAHVLVQEIKTRISELEGLVA